MKKKNNTGKKIQQQKNIRTLKITLYSNWVFQQNSDTELDNGVFGPVLLQLFTCTFSQKWPHIFMESIFYMHILVPLMQEIKKIKLCYSCTVSFCQKQNRLFYSLFFLDAVLNSWILQILQFQRKTVNLRHIFQKIP